MFLERSNWTALNVSFTCQKQARVNIGFIFKTKYSHIITLTLLLLCAYYILVLDLEKFHLVGYIKQWTSDHLIRVQFRLVLEETIRGVAYRSVHNTLRYVKMYCCLASSQCCLFSRLFLWIPFAFSFLSLDFSVIYVLWPDASNWPLVYWERHFLTAVQTVQSSPPIRFYFYRSCLV